MRLRPFLRRLLLSLCTVPAVLAWQRPALGQTPPSTVVTGVLEVQWGDPHGGAAARMRYAVRPDEGPAVEFEPTRDALRAFGASARTDLAGWAGRRVTVSGRVAPLGRLRAGPQAIVADAIDAVSGAGEYGALPAPSAVTGSQPWISILCKFQDYSTEPRTYAYHQSLYGSSEPALDHYWRTVSYENINIVGSAVAGSGWYTLPHPRSYYVYDAGSGLQLDFSRAANDCTAQADPAVNFAPYVGINLMFNAELDGYAWGGSSSVTVDGQTRWFRMTWEPPWGQEQAVLAHEMGHGFGLPHSSDTYGHTYGSGWDVMSGGTYMGSRDPTWGWIAVETIGFHKDRLGWVPSARVFEASSTTIQTIPLERLDEPLSSAGYLVAKLPIPGGSTYLTVEARQKVGYDVRLPASGVILHEVNPGRSSPANVLDLDNDGDAKDAGAAMQPGQSYTHPSGIQVSVLSASGSTYSVRIRMGIVLTHPLDFTGDGRSDVAVYRPSTGSWLVNGGATTVFGLPTDVPVPGDYDGNGITEVAVWRPSTGQWFLGGQTGAIAFGQAGDIPAPADYDGDGSTDVAVFRRGVWYILGQPGKTWGQAGDVPVPGDYDGNGHAEAAVFRRSNNAWYVEGQPAVAWGAYGDVPVAEDFDGNGAADIAVFRPSTGTWYIRGIATVQWGQAGDIPLALNLDGSNGADLVVYRPSNRTWYGYDLVSHTVTQVVFGQAGDRPLGLRPGALPAPPGDRDADWRTDLAVYRPSNGTWYVRPSAGGATTTFAWGTLNDVPVATDYDGDGRMDYAVFRPSTGVWWVRTSGSADVTVMSARFGQAGDRPVPADFDGDGRADLAVFRPASGTWYVSTSSSNFTSGWSRAWGTSSDVPVARDFDRDGRADLAVFRASTGTWYVLRSSSSFTTASTMAVGTTGDVPVAADWDGDGAADAAVYRPSTGGWLAIASSTGAPVTLATLGAPGDVPFVGDFSGDFRPDPATFDPATGTWQVRGRPNTTWGTSGDLLPY